MHQPLYNPALLRDADLKDSFAVRERELDELLRMIGTQPEKGALQHALMVGSRGMGKTTLGLRFLLAVREDPELSTKWQPVPFFEESYGIIDLASLWLTALQHLSDATGDGQWRDRAHALLKSEPDTARLEAQALNLLIDFYRESTKRLLLFIENIDEIFAQFPNQDDVARLRAVLQERSEFFLIGTANTVFGEITDQSKPFYEFFRLFRLNGLDSKETRAFVDKLASRLQSSTLKQILEGDPARIEVIRRFTGGNPRLIELASRLITESPMGGVRDDLERLIDDQTPYFKARIENLPHQLRAIFHSLAASWRPMSAREIAKLTRLSSSQASAQLKKLQSLGYVEVIRPETKRRLRYQVLERFYNMYYLLRFTRGQRQRLERLINFVHQLFGPSSIERMFEATLDRCRLHPESSLEQQETLPVFVRYVANWKDSEHRKDWWKRALKLCTDRDVVLRELIELAPDVLGGEMSSSDEYKAALERYVQANQTDVSGWLLLAEVLEELGHTDDSVHSLREAEALRSDRPEVWHQTGVLYARMDRLDQAESCFRRLISLTPHDPHPYVHLAQVLEVVDRSTEAKEATDEALELGPDEYWDWFQLGHLLSRQMRVDDAVKAFRRAIKIDPDVILPHLALGELLDSLDRHEDAAKEFEKAVILAPKDASAWIALGFHAVRAQQIAEAERAFQRAIDLNPNDSAAWTHLGQFMTWETDKLEKAENALRMAIELDKQNSHALHDLGVILERQDRFGEAEEVYRDYMAVSPIKEHGLAHLAKILRDMGRKGEGEATLREFLNSNSKSSLAWGYLGSYLAADHRLDEAIECLQSAVELEDDNADHLSSLAWYMFKRLNPGDLEEAYNYAHRAVDLNMDKPKILLSVAAIVGAYGDWDKALYYADVAISRGGIKWCESHIRELIDIFVEASAKNFGGRALELLKESNISSLVEPLTTAIMLELDKEVEPVPEEIINATDEIRRRINERRNVFSHGVRFDAKSVAH